MSVYIKKIKGTLSGLRHCLTTESSLKMNKKAFYFTMKVLFVLKIFRFLSQPFGFVEKQLDQKDKVYFKIYDVRTWSKNNCNTHIAEYLKK